MKTIYAIYAIERDKTFGEAANILPGDVFDAPEAEANRLVNMSAAREASDEDVALAEVRKRRFTTNPVTEESAQKVEQTLTNAKGGKKAAPKGDAAPGNDALV